MSYFSSVSNVVGSASRAVVSALTVARDISSIMVSDSNNHVSNVTGHASNAAQEVFSGASNIVSAGVTAATVVGSSMSSGHALYGTIGVGAINYNLNACLASVASPGLVAPFASIASTVTGVVARSFVTHPVAAFTVLSASSMFMNNGEQITNVGRSLGATARNLGTAATETANGAYELGQLAQERAGQISDYWNDTEYDPELWSTKSVYLEKEGDEDDLALEKFTNIVYNSVCFEDMEKSFLEVSMIGEEVESI